MHLLKPVVIKSSKGERAEDASQHTQGGPKKWEVRVFSSKTLTTLSHFID
jgi:hypothetical protein